MRTPTTFVLAILALGLSSWAQPDLQSLVYRAPQGGYSGLEGAVTIYDRSHAVVIGVTSYQSLPTLPGAVRDARAVAEALGKQGFDVTLLLDQEASRSRIAEELGDRLPLRLGRNDRVLIYFAGHGVTVGPDDAPMGYLMPVEGHNQRRASTGISMREVQAWIAGYRSKHVLFAADACYSGLALTTRSTGLPTTLSDYLRQVTEREVRLAFTAGRADQEAHEWRGQGLFTFFFLQALEGAADFNGDGILTSNELSAYLEPNVAQTALDNWRAEQNPQTARSGQGEFIFLVPRRAPAPKPDDRPAPSEEAEITFWKSIEDSSYAEDFEAYLKKFPSGLFVDLAKSKIARLAQAAAEDQPEASPAPPASRPAAVAEERSAPEKEDRADPVPVPSKKPLRVVGQAQSQEELDAWKSLQQENDGARRIQLNQEFLKTFPDSGLTPFAHYDLAVLHRQADPEKFIIHGEAALQEIPELPDILAYLAFYYSETGRSAEAVDRANRVLELLDGMAKPPQVSDAQWVARKHEFKAEARYALARVDLSNAVNGEGEEATDGMNQAAAGFQLALRHAPAHPYASFRLAEVHARMGRAREALEAFARTAAIGGAIGKHAEENCRELHRQLHGDEKGLEELIARQRRQVEAELAQLRQSMEKESNPPSAPTLRKKP